MGNAADRAGAPSERGPGTWDRLPWLLRWAVLGSGCLLVISAGLYVLGLIATRLAPLTIALAATLFLAALLDPMATWLRRYRVPPAPAALAALLVLLGALVGSVTLIWRLTADQFADLSRQLDEGLARTRDFLTSGALPISPEQLDQWTRRTVDGLRRAAPDPVAGAATVAEAAGALLLVLVLLFSCSRTGARCGTGC